MAKFSTMEEVCEEVAEKFLDDFGYKGKTIREWAGLILRDELVEVVRCRECKYYDPIGCRFCTLHSIDAGSYGNGANVYMNPDDFCSYGERSDGE